MTETTARPEVAPPVLDDGDHEKFAHYVFPSWAVTESYATGKPVTALCGKTWVPTRDPDNYPVCPTCKSIFNSRNTQPEGPPSS